MKVLNSLTVTIISGFLLAVIILLILTSSSGFHFNSWSLLVWLHLITGTIWLGLLYYFNLSQVFASSNQAEINSQHSSTRMRVLSWYRWSAVLTWIAGVGALEAMGLGILPVFLFQTHALVLSIGVWLATMMLLSVWFLSWPQQKKQLRLHTLSADELAKSQRIDLFVSRVNVILSIPMLMCMVAHGHGLPL